jgi:UDP-N-acetylmuramyl pentapeptide phosphotransferase/UDP-N-acetylglucosamine-1-phosphate transferase
VSQHITFAALLWLTSAVVVWTLSFLVRHSLLRWNVVDLPNERSSHVDPTTRGGGVAIMAAILAGGGALSLGNAQGELLTVILGSAVLLAIVSFADDLRSVSPAFRFGCHAVATFAVLHALERSGFAPAGESIWRHPAAASVLWLCFFLWIAGYTNAFNFMDGINGIAAMQALMTGLGTAILVRVASGTWSSEPACLALVVAGASAGFLPHNFPNARMFMGDVGSAPLGFLLAVTVIWGTCDHGWTLVVPLMLLHANFSLDTGFTLLRRIVRGEQWYKAHREHFYQKLVRAGRTHAFVTTCEMLLQLLVISLLVVYLQSGYALKLFVFLTIVAVWAGFFLFCEREFNRRQRIMPVRE